MWAVRVIGVEVKYRVAKGFEETWGSERNSSRSIVPELSCTETEHEEQKMDSMEMHPLYPAS